MPYADLEIRLNAQTNVSSWTLSLLSIAQDKMREVGHYNMGGECTLSRYVVARTVADAICVIGSRLVCLRRKDHFWRDRGRRHHHQQFARKKKMQLSDEQQADAP